MSTITWDNIDQQDLYKNLGTRAALRIRVIKTLYAEKPLFRNLGLLCGLLLIASSGIGGFYLFSLEIPALAFLMIIPFGAGIVCLGRVYSSYWHASLITNDKKNNYVLLKSLLEKHDREQKEQGNKSKNFVKSQRELLSKRIADSYNK